MQKTHFAQRDQEINRKNPDALASGFWFVTKHFQKNPKIVYNTRMSYDIILYIIFGLLPSLAWLAYYLREDVNPEPKMKVLKVFIWGILVTIPVFLVQVGLVFLLGEFNFFPDILIAMIYWFLIIALSEELFIYLVIKFRVLGKKELDEPLDIMLYMIIAALGFSALENMLYLFSPNQMSFYDLVNKVLVVIIFRFFGGTLLHTLCSGAFGYFLAVSSCAKRNKVVLLFISGIFLAVLLHGLYDFSIMTLNGYMRLVVPLAILIGLAIFVSYGFNKLRKMKGICKI